MRTVRRVAGKGSGNAKGKGQLALPRASGHGGRRKGAGRKAGPRPRVLHRTRPAHARAAPIHLTMRAKKGLPSLRREAIVALVRKIVAELDTETFRIVHHSVQRDHLHLIGEAEDRDALTAGMRRVAIRFAMRLNGLLGRRKGKVWDHRYHRRDLRTPREVRGALVYVLMNAKKHGAAAAGASLVDPCSSAPWFDGFADRPPTDTEEEARPPPRARTWLLAFGWRRHGLVATTEAPRAA